MQQDIIATAENVILGLKRDKYGEIELKPNQIRKILAAINTLNNKIKIYKLKTKTKELSIDLVNEIKYQKIMLVYQSGRYPSVVKPFVEKAKLLEEIDSIGASIAKYENFVRYVEALVAYHKFYFKGEKNR